MQAMLRKLDAVLQQQCLQTLQDPLLFGTEQPESQLAH